MRKLIVLLAGLGLSACSESAGPERPAKPNISGHWEGSVASASLELTIIHDTVYGGVSGAGYMGGASFETTLTADGVMADSVVTLNLASSGVDIFSLTGTHKAGSIDGRLNGSGFVNAPVQLLKH